MRGDVSPLTRSFQSIRCMKEAVESGVAGRDERGLSLLLVPLVSAGHFDVVLVVYRFKDQGRGKRLDE